MAPRSKAKSKNKNWISGAIKRPGAFTRKANAHGMSVSSYAKQVKRKCKANPSDHNQMWATKTPKSAKETRTCRQANLAVILEGMGKRRRSSGRRHYRSRRR